MPAPRTPARKRSTTQQPRLPLAEPQAPPPPPAPPAARRLLVTGAGGCVGAELVRQARIADWEIVAVSHAPRRGVPAGVIHVSAELAGDGWQHWCSECTAAVHLAGIVREDADRGATFDRVHRVATERVVAACRAHGIRRLVHVSALGARRDAATAYLRSKWAGEEVVRVSGLAWTIVRPALVFGPGDGFFTTLARVMRRLPVFPVFGNGAYILQPIAVSDVATALLAALDVPAAEGATVELGGPEALPYTEIVRRTAAALGLRRSLLHLPLGVSRFAVRALQWVPGVPITPDQLTMLLAGSRCDATAASRLFDAPRHRYEGPVWLMKQATGDRQ